MIGKILSAFRGAWVVLWFILNFFAVIGMFMNAGSFWDGMNAVWDTYSPYNVTNWIVEIIALSPALAITWWLDVRPKAGDSRNVQQAEDYRG